VRSVRSVSGTMCDIYEGGGPAVAFLSAQHGGRAEWRPILRGLVGRMPDLAALAYDRPGYGDSRASPRDRSPDSLALELSELLDEFLPGRRVILVGHSLGGLYAQAFARAFPDRTLGLVLVDPLTPWNGEFRERLSPAEFKASGVDKSGGARLAAVLGALGLLGFLRRMASGLPPLSLRDDWSPEDRRDQLRVLLRRSTYLASLEETRFYEDESVMAALRDSASFPPVPIRLLVHSPAAMIDYSCEFGTPRPLAEKVEAIWRSLFERLLAFSRDARLEQSAEGGHYLHQTEPGLLEDAVLELPAFASP
jgi:pimeloyl-ACP methyl ester carboxylesterase